jgi:WD40 repeat protein
MVGNYLTSCLTQCLHIETYGQARSLITAGTDGYIAFFPLESGSVTATTEPSALKWTFRANVHQNTIHSMKLHWFDNKTCLLVTGGDDNAVAFTIMAWDAVGTRPKVDTVIVPRAHTAAVTGVEILAAPGLRWLRVATTSIDQRVRIWEVHYNGAQPGIEGLTVKRKGNYFTAVADVSGLAALDTSSLIVCGVGMDVWSHSGLRSG